MIDNLDDALLAKGKTVHGVIGFTPPLRENKFVQASHLQPTTAQVLTHIPLPQPHIRPRQTTRQRLLAPSPYERRQRDRPIHLLARCSGSMVTFQIP
jgi:hypothetical protein